MKLKVKVNFISGLVPLTGHHPHLITLKNSIAAGCFGLLVVAPAAALADAKTPVTGDQSPAVTAPEAGEPAIEISGYGQLLFRYHNYGPDQTREGGSPADNRLVFDTTRFVVELEGHITEQLEWEAEVEFEHGGTGAALELEYEEFGEFEQEIEKAGEVVVEELYLENEITDWLRLKAGRFYVAVGLLSELYLPTDLLGAARPESETTMLPAVWDELGVAAEIAIGNAELTLQIVNGLDSSRFSSQRWVALGHQGVFELIRATGLAAVARVDAHAAPGLTVGASAYAGDTVPNRPNPDMEGVFAPVVIADVHAIYERGPIRARGVAIWGHLDDAARISQKNSRLSNNLDAPRSPVAEQAMAAWAEVGVDVGPIVGLAPCHRLEPFLRFERYDTMFDTGGFTFDNPRFSRTVFSAGAHYTFAERAVAVADVVHRRFGSSDYRPETTVEVGLGFTY